jgi:hypothetical protein
MFLGLRHGALMVVMTFTSPGMGAALFPPGSPLGLLRLEKVLDIMNFFDHGAVLELVLDMVWVM